MRMRAQHMPQSRRHARTAVLMLMLMVMVMLVAIAVNMTVASVMVGGARIAHNAQDAPENLLQHLHHSAADAPANQSLSDK